MKNQDTYSYKGWLSSDNFIKRALGAYGYMLVGSFIIVVGFVLVAAVISLLIAVIGLIT